MKHKFLQYDFNRFIKFVKKYRALNFIPKLFRIIKICMKLY